MQKYHITSGLVPLLQSQKRFAGLTPDQHERLYRELRNAILQGIDTKLLDLANGGEKRDNKVQSLLLWVVGITDEMPTKDQALKSPGSMADIDVDYSQERREEVFDYMTQKYGADKVSYVATFGTLAAKAAIRSAARALGLPISVGEKISKFVPKGEKIKIKDALESKELQKLIQTDKSSKSVIDLALKLEGLPNNIGCHASAVVISDVSLTKYVPLMVATKKKDANDKDVAVKREEARIMTQLEYKDVESIGCLKFDNLGLKTLDVIQKTCELVKRNHGIDIDIETIDVNDPKIYEVLVGGYVTGVFQMESDMFKDILFRIQPNSIDEISDITSLMRPGPMSSGMHEQYIGAKFNGQKCTYNLKDQNLIDKVWEICSRSYGLLIYQEQAIRCFTDIGGFNEIEGDNARRAMGKKKPEEMAALKEQFMEGGKQKGFTEDDLKELFDQIEGFSGYGFNASHAVSYSYITCQTAWLSAYYPLEFYTALLTIDSDKTDDVRRYIKAVKERGFKITAPDINMSDIDFVIGTDSIIFGLSGIKGVGASVSKKILKRRPKNGYRSLGHFILRNVDLINSKVIESYTKAGLFTSLNINKQTVLNSLPYILDFVGIYKGMDRYTIFDLCKISAEDYINKCIIRTSNEPDNLSYEIESLGVYITRHPMDEWIVNRDRATDLDKFSVFDHDDPFITVGCISSVAVKKTKAKANMCSFDITTSLHSVPCIVFPQAYSRMMNEIAEGKMVVVGGKVKEEETGKILIVDSILSDYSRYVCKIQKKVESIHYMCLDDMQPADFTQNVIYVKIGNLRFTLEK